MRILLAAVVALLLAAPGASAQLLDPNCPPTVWCHPDGSGMGGPNGFMDGMTDAADAVGRALIDYECKGGYDCLGVALRDILCAIDGREIAQIACGGGDGGDGGGDNGGGDDSGSTGSTGSTGSASTQSARDAGSQQLKAGTMGVTLQGYNAESFLAEVGRTRVGSRLRMDGPRAMEFTLQAKYSDADDRPNRYIAVINAMAQGMQPTQMVVLVDQGRTRVVHHSAFRSVRRGR